MKRDPAIDEIRQVRHRISERYDHNTRALLEHYKALERRLGFKVDLTLFPH